MSGHSKWASIKHKKGAKDAKRGKLFSKLGKEITVAARQGGGDLDTNPRLRTVVQAARDANMPADNISRAVKKGTGELPGVSYEEVVYEGYGPAGVAILIRALTDNRNRSTAEIRNIFDKKGGNLAGPGSVAYLFEKKGFFSVAREGVDEEELFAMALEAGAEDFRTEDDLFEIYTLPSDFEAVRKALSEQKIPINLAEITELSTNEVPVSADVVRKVLGLLNALEEHDDIQNVYSNCDIPEEILKELESED
ncbi:MAG: YebC/PmpR family DNA-binding transcriptional regulator [Candidatus Euphemobacter frigidus]|nr:YebC/PmpR family DNA-binding transcriptional regulator [Candidatus Euphemobacter frigidus]MDP8275952.1 YebC/PmpR family DNA-binding transcriptional regulator [Candidatus Euphemobacter frigidus]